ncbi:MAG TPA: hypothetical protein PLR25_15230 [Planctomycetaceae bacterium]|nr:hypothetical protein [Planctomycetaceae bacterium]
MVTKVCYQHRQKERIARIETPVSSSIDGGAVDVNVMDHGIRFAEACGGIDKAREILSVIERIWQSHRLGSAPR